MAIAINSIVACISICPPASFMQKLTLEAPPAPTVTPKLQQPKFGFNEYSERLNGRAAMIGFSLMIIIEYVTNQGVFAWLGLK